jgi:hypothetical protein
MCFSQYSLPPVVLACDFFKRLLYYQNIKQDKARQVPVFLGFDIASLVMDAQHFKITTLS